MKTKMNDKKKPKIDYMHNLMDETLEWSVDGKVSQVPIDYWIGNAPLSASGEWKCIREDINKTVNKFMVRAYANKL